VVFEQLNAHLVVFEQLIVAFLLSLDLSYRVENNFPPFILKKQKIKYTHRHRSNVAGSIKNQLTPNPLN
jgi:hypothetical protein